MSTKQLKLITATVGATGALAMGALAVAFSGTTLADPADPAPPGPITEPVVEAPDASMAETSTEEAPPPEPATPSAVPPIEGPAPLPPELEGVPG